MNDREESKMEAKRKDRELYEKVMQENAKANAAEEDSALSASPLCYELERAG